MAHQFLLLFRGGDPARAGFSPHTAMKHWADWVASLRHDSRFVHGEPVHGSEGRVLRSEGAVTRGCIGAPDAAVTGYLALQADSLDQAQSLAADCPALLHGGTVEVRPIFVVNGGA